MILVQTVADLIFLTLLLHFSGGIENSLYIIFVFHVVIAAMTLSATHSYLVTTAATVLLCAMSLGEYSGLLPHREVGLTPHTSKVSHSAGDTAAHAAAHTKGREFSDAAHAKHPAPEAHRERAVADPRVPNAPESKERQTDTADDTASRHHPAHDLAFVLGRLLPFVGILYCLTYLTRIVVTHLHLRERQLLRALRKRKEAQAQLVQAGKMAAIGELAGNFAHEINNPVAVIAGKAKLLLDEYGPNGLPDAVLSDLRKIDLHAERIGAITSGLLAFSRPSIGKKEPTRLRDVVRSTLPLVDDAIRANCVNLVCNLDENASSVEGNANELQQVLLNLLNNALDAMPGGGTLTITLKNASRRIGGEACQFVTLSVADTGPGLDASIRSRIFEPFFTTKPEGKGTGLGSLGGGRSLNLVLLGLKPSTAGWLTRSAGRLQGRV